MSQPSGQTSHNIRVTAASVTTSSTQILAENRNRYGIIFQNVHTANPIAITPTSFGAAALNTAGSIMLAAGGSLVITDVRCVDAFNAIAGTGTTPLTIFEF